MDIALAVVGVVLVLLLVFTDVEEKPVRKGRHAGKYKFRLPWPREVFLRGLHRGKYKSKPEWGDEPPSNLSGKSASISCSKPVRLFLPDGSLRDLKAEGWVDLFLPDGSLRDLKAEGWVDLGMVDTVE